ncbi:MAG: FHA domain-containing protein [Holophagaceae bacterium]|nr:FHA domain-containing protein [Holophagaceae bacterium]
MAHLRVFTQDGAEARESLFQLERDQVLIGRDPACDLVLQGIGASRRHAVIQRTATGWLVVDQGGANGTLVQGQRIASHELRNGDTLQMGNSSLVFEDEPAETAAPQWIWCARCGAPAPLGTWACAGCGQPFDGPPQARQSREKQGRGGCLWIAAGGCLLALLLVAGLVAFVLWRAGGIEGLTRRSISPARTMIQD